MYPYFLSSCQSCLRVRVVPPQNLIYTAVYSMLPLLMDVKLKHVRVNYHKKFKLIIDQNIRVHVGCINDKELKARPRILPDER